MVADNKERGGTVVQAYSPLARGSLASNKKLANIGAKYGMSAAQVGLRWIIQKGATFTTSSSSKAHFVEDLDVVTNPRFVLSAADMKDIDSGI
jgi:diketogulonate reductase-like aldo/keto reductase